VTKGTRGETQKLKDAESYGTVTKLYIPSFFMAQQPLMSHGFLTIEAS
jgi:hypothetical protein